MEVKDYKEWQLNNSMCNKDIFALKFIMNLNEGVSHSATCLGPMSNNTLTCKIKQVSFKKEVGVRVN